MSDPRALAFDSSGNLYVVSNSNNTVSEFAPGSTIPIATYSTGLSEPDDLAFDSSGNLYVTNLGNNTVSKFTPGSTTASNTYTGLSHPYALAFDSSGNLYVTNLGNNTVSKFAPGSTTAGVTYSVGLDYPIALAFDSNGNLYVANSSDNRVSKFAPGSTTPSATYSAGLSDPHALAFDSSGDLYVANVGNSTVSKFAPGSTTARATYSTGLSAPGDLAFDSSGNLYVANADNSTVCKFSASSTTPTAGGVVIQSSVESRPMLIGGTNSTPVAGINLTSAELAQITTTGTGTVTIGDSSQTGNITFSTASPTTTTGTTLNVIQSAAGSGQITLDDASGSATGLNGNGGTVILTPGTGGIQTTLFATGTPLATNGFSASGKTLNLTLGFAPTPGMQLTIINNTATPAASNLISGTFSNLGQGSTVTLSYQATAYSFHANYQAADGNDLVLTSPATPNVSVTDSGGTYNGSAYAATTASLEGVTPTLTYYSGTSATGTALSGAPTTVGTYTVLASFAGSTDYTSGTASTTFTISKATPIVSVTDNSGTYNGVAFMAMTASLEGVTPSLIYYSGTSATDTALSGAPTSVGTYTVVASFAGSADYTAAQSSPLTFTISQAPLTITANNLTKVVDSANPPLTFTAAGFVVGDTLSSLSTQPTLSTTAATDSPVGTYPITVSGAVETNYSISYVNGTLIVTPVPIATTTKIKSSDNSSVYGESVTFTATITASSGKTKPSGTVTFSDGNAVLGTASASNGTATFTTSALTVGSHSITAVYAGIESVSASFSESASAVLAETVAQAVTTTTLSASSTRATSGQSVTFTAKVVPTSPGTGTPTGTVTFKDGSITLGAATLSPVTGGAQATFATSTLPIGTDSITAVYAGSTDYTTSTSKALSVKIRQAAAATPWQNPVNPLDVLGTGGPITPADALAVINYLSTQPAGTILPPTFAAGSDYYDVLGLGAVVPADALAIIDYLSTTPAVTNSTTGANSVSSAASAAGSAASSPATAQPLVSAEISLPLPTQSSDPVVSPAVVAAGQVSGPVSNSNLSSSSLSALVRAGSTEPPQSSVKPSVASATQSANNRSPVDAVDSLLANPLLNWLDE